MIKSYSMRKKLIPVSSPLITINDAKNVYKVVKVDGFHLVARKY